MNECYVDNNGDLVISEWYRSGGRIYRRDCMDYSHKESMFQCIKRLGGNPYKELNIECPSCKAGLNCNRDGDLLFSPRDKERREYI